MAEIIWKSIGSRENDVCFNKATDPNGWIQFKGSDICMDVHCVCGESTHIDGDFLYFIACGSCGQVYELNGYIQLIPRNDENIPDKEDIISTQ